jgi:hypothetical protein
MDDHGAGSYETTFEDEMKRRRPSRPRLDVADHVRLMLTMLSTSTHVDLEQ